MSARGRITAIPAVAYRTRMSKAEPATITLDAEGQFTGIPIVFLPSTGQRLKFAALYHVRADWRWIRAELALTQRQMAARLQVTSMTIVNWEREDLNKRRSPAVYVFASIFW